VEGTIFLHEPGYVIVSNLDRTIDTILSTQIHADTRPQSSNPFDQAPMSTRASSSPPCAQNPAKGSCSEPCIRNRRMMIEEVAEDFFIFEILGLCRDGQQAVLSK
jgi:hypothetical protein